MFDPVPAPPGDIVKRTLQFFWIADYSSSMEGRKIETLNRAIREALPQVKNALTAHPEVQMQMRSIKFSDSASWHVGPAPVSLEQFRWSDLSASGSTATAQAIQLLTDELSVEKMGRRGYPPVCVLISDGYCTDPTAEYEEAIGNLKKLPWGQKAVRLAIGVGDESHYDEAQLLKFVSHPEIGVLKAHTVEQLIAYIKFVTVDASLGASVGKSRIQDINDPNTPAVSVALADVPVITSAGQVF